MSLSIISAKYASINELLSLYPSMNILLVKLLVLFMPNAHVATLSPLLLMPIYPMLFTDKLALESVAQAPFNSDLV